MINVSSLFHLWQHSWLTDFLVSWVNTLLGIEAYSQLEQSASVICQDVVPSYGNHKLTIPSKRRDRWANTLSDALWLG